MVKFTKKEEFKEEVKEAKKPIKAEKELKAGDEAYKQSEHTVIIKGN